LKATEKYVGGPYISLFQEIYWGVVEAILKYYWRVFSCDLEEISMVSIIFPICFQLNRVENGNEDSSSEANFKSSITSRAFSLDLKVSIFVKIFEFYLVSDPIP
jgi:hypothetical protein